MSDGQRTAIVTGAAGGIGRALVRGLLDAGIRVAASDRTAEGLAALARSAREQGKEAALLTIEADLTRDDAVDKIVSAARAAVRRDRHPGQQCRGRAGDDPQRQPAEPDQVLGGDAGAVAAVRHGS